MQFYFKYIESNFKLRTDAQKQKVLAFSNSIEGLHLYVLLLYYNRIQI